MKILSRGISLIAAALLGFSAIPQPDSAQQTAELPNGWLLWHSYSSYSALDSRLFLRAPNGNTQEIKGNFVHAMNGSFGIAPDIIVFMAIDQAADEWDIFLCDGGRITNLTQHSGFRNEDPKWSPDGTKIVFKRGHWDSGADDFVYNLALMDVQTGAVGMLTDDSTEQAMPCFSQDGNELYFTAYSDRTGAICCMNLNTKKTAAIFSENGVNAYYPIVSGDNIYFTKWYSSENKCDQIVRYDGNTVTVMPFDSPEYDCSDACPAGGGMIYSSTRDGAYNLYYFDGEQSVLLSDCSSTQNDLGACFYPQKTGDLNADGAYGTADAVLLQKWLLTVPDAQISSPDAADMNRDGVLNAADLGLLKRALSA